MVIPRWLLVTNRVRGGTSSRDTAGHSIGMRCQLPNAEGAEEQSAQRSAAGAHTSVHDEPGRTCLENRRSGRVS